jgi:predicted AlkP superfamily phosphohydrolase/phosphomutase
MREPRLSGAARAVLIVLAVAQVTVSGCGARRAPPVSLPPAATTLVGIDGADWRNALPLVRQGKLPVVAALLRAGSAATMLTNPDYRWSPVLWTSIATGKLPDKHGVHSFFATVEGFERPMPTPSVSRRCKAIWNLFSDQGLTTGFVGWWVTWPAESVNGFMVSDHFSVSRFDLGHEYDSGEPQDPGYYARQTYPEELAQSLQHLKVSRQEITRDDLARFAALPADFQFSSQFKKFDRVSEFAIAHSVDRTHLAVARELLERERPALCGVFFQGTDIMQHFFWELMDPQGTGTNPSIANRDIFGESIERYYAWIDGVIGELLVTGGDGRAIVLVSDHGFRPSTERFEEKGISGEHRRQALFLLAGPGVRRAQRLDDVDAVDVTPTLLAYHGMPIARDMDGAPIDSALTDALLRQRPLTSIETYETGERVEMSVPDVSVSRELEERINSIGYIN